MSNKKEIDMDGGDLDILVDGQLVLHIGQVSDDDVVDLFFCPQGEGGIEEHEKVEPDDPCTHRLIVKRKGNMKVSEVYFKLTNDGRIEKKEMPGTESVTHEKGELL